MGDQKRWSWIHRVLIAVGVIVFIPLVYLGTAPYLVNAMMPVLDSSSTNGVFMKGVEIYFWPVEQVCDIWPWYEKWGASIVLEK